MSVGAGSIKRAAKAAEKNNAAESVAGQGGGDVAPQTAEAAGQDAAVRPEDTAPQGDTGKVSAGKTVKGTGAKRGPKKTTVAKTAGVLAEKKAGSGRRAAGVLAEKNTGNDKKAPGATAGRNTGSGRKAAANADVTAESGEMTTKEPGKYEAYGVGQELPTYLM